MTAVGTSRHLAIYVGFRGELDIAAQREASGKKLGRATWGRGAGLPDRQAHYMLYQVG